MRRYLALYALLFVALGVVIAVAARREARQGAPPVPSTWILGQEGYRAAWSLLERSGVPVRRHVGPLDDLPGGTGHILVISAPRARPVEELEANSLRAWISEGNTLLWLTALGNPSTYARDVTGRRTALDLVRDTEGHLEWAVGASLNPVEMEVDDEAGPLERYLAAVPGLSFTEGVEEFFVGPSLDLQVQGKGWIPMAGTLQGVSVQMRQLGEGHIWIFPTPHFLDNAGLARADNVVVLRNLVREHLGEGLFLFDEYHHGYTPSPLASITGSSVFRTILFQGALLLGLYLWSRGRRFGPAVALERDERRPAVEYLHAMGAILRRGGKTREVAADLVHDFRLRLEARAGISARSPQSVAVAVLERRTGRDWSSLGAWLREGEQGRVDRPRYLVRLARAIRAAERSLEFGSRARRR